eukprot:5679340-Pleurochrysis_carterae.AAC.1
MARARDSWTFPASKCAAIVCHSQQVLTITAPQVLAEALPKEPRGSSSAAPAAAPTWQHATLLFVLLAGHRLVVFSSSHAASLLPHVCLA